MPAPTDVPTDAPELTRSQLSGHLTVGNPKTAAAGLPAVASSLKHMYQRAGFGKGTKALLNLNQTGGFDCPSCAWPDPEDHRSSFEFCENGAKALASEATAKRATPAFFADHSLADLAEMSDFELDQAGRLTQPMVLRPGSTHYQPLDWQDAFDLIARELNALSSPDEAVFYTSGRASNEAAFLYQLFVRDFGTNNLPDCSNMCHESSGLAMNTSVGVGKGTVTLRDLECADVIIIAGQNPGTNHPRMLSTLQKAVDGGTHIIAVNPLREAGLSGFMHPQHISGAMGKATALAKDFLPVKANGDMALFRGFAKALLEAGAQDEAFIAQHTTGFPAYKAQVESESWERIESLSGIAKCEIVRLAEIIAKRRKLITCWAMGLTQHHNAVATIREVIRLHLLIGAIGHEGAGLCPVRGHSNVQGDRTVGVFEKMPEWFHASLDREFSIETPRAPGYDTVAAIQAMHEGKVGAFIALGGNFLQAAPDTAYTAEALRNCKLTVHIATKLNRSHLVHGTTALLLPCLGRSEADLRQDGEDQFVTVEDSMSVVHASHGVLAPASEHLLSETQIIAGMAAATLKHRSRIPYIELGQDYDLIRDHLSRIVPGMEDYNERVRQPSGFYMPNPARHLKWDTPEGRAVFHTDELTAFDPGADRLTLQTFRSHDQFNTTVYGPNDRYRGIGNERRVIFMNPDDVKARGLSPMQSVRITSHWNGVKREASPFVVIPYEMPRGCCAAYYPEASPLVPIDSMAALSHTPTSQSVAVTLQPV
jgi:molybdopterin-dependent oxidoreductase alpha subunit